MLGEAPFLFSLLVFVCVLIFFWFVLSPTRRTSRSFQDIFSTHFLMCSGKARRRPRLLMVDFSLQETGYYRLSLVRNLSLDKFRQQSQRFLPAEIARLGRNDRGHTFLRDVQLSSAGYFLQRDRHLHFSRQVRIVELVRVTDALVGFQFEITPAEGVALAGGEICE